MIRIASENATNRVVTAEGAFLRLNLRFLYRLFGRRDLVAGRGFRGLNVCWGFKFKGGDSG